MNLKANVLIVGGGPAGLSAAMALGRMGVTAMICDDNRPRNAPAEHMNNFPSRDGMSPADWREQVRGELKKYLSISFLDGALTGVKHEVDGFAAEFSEGRTGHFKKIILANGVRDKTESIDGLAELWGKSVFHCPYCHGFEIRGSALGLVANGPHLSHMTPMIYQLSTDLVLFLNGAPLPDPEFVDLAKRRNLRIVEERIVRLHREGDQLVAVELSSGEKIERRHLFWAPSFPFELKSSIGESLGCERTEMGFLKVDAMNKTTVDGVFAAGDTSTMMHSVLGAAASGQLAGAAAASEILGEKFRAK